MYEIRVHGRGGQGAVTAAELIVAAAFKNGAEGVQAFPSFGVERRGAPVTAFARIDKHKKIRLRSQIYEPDCVIVIDPTLAREVDVLAGLKENGVVILNSPNEFLLKRGDKYYAENAYFVDAIKIALETIGKPIPNVAMLGAFAKIMENKFGDNCPFSLDALESAVNEKFEKKIVGGNIKAAQRCYAEVKEISGEAKEIVEMRPAILASKKLEIKKVVAPGTTKRNKTGGWRVFMPVLDPTKCSGCGNCAQYCPEPCVEMADKKPVIDYDYCKGCEICAAVCPRKAITMKQETGSKYNKEISKSY